MKEPETEEREAAAGAPGDAEAPGGPAVAEAGPEVEGEAAGEGPAGAEGAAGEAAPPPGGDEAARLREELERQRREASEYLDLLRRVKADFDNFRRRAERELAESREAGAAELARSLLVVLDNLERAAEAEGGEDALREGVRMTLRQMREVLSRAGVERIEALGRPFDPALHEALLSVPAGEVPPGTVARVFEEGYKMGDRLLRPAKVAVAAEAEAGDEGSASASAGKEGSDG